MDQTVNGRHGSHGIFEDPFPLTEHEIGCNHDRFAFIALCEEREEHLHFITVLLDIPDIIENDTGEFIQFCQFLW